MRYPAVSGAFYPNSADSLRRDVDSFLSRARKEVDECEGVRAIVCPHAGYIYSGFTAAHSFVAAKKALGKENTTVIMVGPNHTGLGKMISVSFEDWDTPIGRSLNDVQVAGAIIKASAVIQRDEGAHLQEHSLEVQLPFLQRINPKTRIVPICMMDQTLQASREVGKVINQIVEDERFKDRNFVVLASSDFTHMQSGKDAQRMDSGPLRSIEKMDDEEFQKEVFEKDISICGHGPIASIIEYCRLSGVKNSKLLRYTNSGRETDGDEERVVAYASIVFW